MATQAEYEQDIEAYWDEYAARYDDEPDHGLRLPGVRTAWQDLLVRVLPPAPSRVADLACGTGTLSALVAGLGHEVQAFDLAGEMVARARAKTDVFGDRVSVARADVSQPPLPVGSVDVVLARHVLWTLPDPWSALGRWVTLLRPGGRLVLVEGRWSSGPDRGQPTGGLPWAGGVGMRELVAAVEPWSSSVEQVALPEAVYWGREITDERYLVVAHRA